jgi:class 3 adenylate cyclase
VTIMFTDVVGSTALRTTIGDNEADELFRAHDALIRAQITENHGRDQNAALGDGFLAVFTSTRRAITAAVGIQRSIEAFNRSRSGTPIRVRVGLNTGEVSWQDGQPFGEAVHAASRVCSAATGGQILISDVTRQLAGTVPDTSFLDTGEHDLKGFPHPWRLWEVVWIRETAQLPRQVFVARTDELAFLRGKLDDALDGKGSFVLVGGEPGVGKTTLVRELIREAESRGALALFGRCYEIEGALPYSPFVEMLEKAFNVMPAEMVREDMADDAPEVARMIPELRNRFPDIPPPLELPPEQQRRYFFNAVSAFVGRGAKRFPLLLVMDDVHWADVPTLLLIERMAELVPNMRSSSMRRRATPSSSKRCSGISSRRARSSTRTARSAAMCGWTSWTCLNRSALSSGVDSIDSVRKRIARWPPAPSSAGRSRSRCSRRSPTSTRAGCSTSSRTPKKPR